MPLMIPVIHLNGTSQTEIEGQLSDAHRAVGAAMTALRRAAPNGRDYYPLGPDAIHRATSEHVARLKKLEEVQKELMEIWEGLPDRESQS